MVDSLEMPESKGMVHLCFTEAWSTPSPEGVKLSVFRLWVKIKEHSVFSALNVAYHIFPILMCSIHFLPDITPCDELRGYVITSYICIALYNLVFPNML